MAQIRTATQRRRLSQAGLVILKDIHGRWLRFDSPVEVIQTQELDRVQDCLSRIEQAVEARGLHAAGFLAYEAAPAFDRALRVGPDPDVPLLWFGLYDSPAALEWNGRRSSGGYRLGAWNASVTPAAYKDAFARVKDQIARGETYQVNYTFRLQARFEGDPLPFFQDLVDRQKGDFPAFVDTGQFAICSASPELFFRLSGEEITAMPMKGTAARGRTYREDQARMRNLRNSAKDQAENVMIVDMLRNDIGKIAEIGTVKVPRLYAVQRYPTLLQMTSTVTGCTRASVQQILAAMFPCASITGAPKVRTMQIIAALETKPRGVYTGSIGYLSPGRQAQFNVAIRTVTVDKHAGLAEYGVGGGIVWDSEHRAEFQESWIKARVLTAATKSFELLETLLWEPDRGFFLLEKHLARLHDSAVYFEIPIDLPLIEKQLHKAVSAGQKGRPQRVRLLVDQQGEVRVEHSALPLSPARHALRVTLAAGPVDSKNVFLYHKTTNRQVYEDARAAFPGFDDVLLWNERRELTEATLANVVVELDGKWVTPPVETGLLAGTFRRHLLESGAIEEGLILLDDLQRAGRLYLINSVRKWLPARLV